MSETFDPLTLLRPRRAIRGMSAIVLPFDAGRQIDWRAFDAHVARTAAAGLTPAVNMDTGYGNLLTADEKQLVLERTQAVLGRGAFVAGAFVKDEPGAAFQWERYQREMDAIQACGGLPVVVQSYGLAHQPGPEVVANYQTLARSCDRFLGFELTTDLAPFGAVYDLETFAGMMAIPQCVGAKHSSFHRQPEWDRLRLRNANRPDFLLMTGNDFAIDMVMYGSDYLLGLSTFCPELFAQRDAWWAASDARFYELNDQLQYLGAFAFRAPSAAYKHNAAQFLHLLGQIETDFTHSESPVRPATDRAVLREIAVRLGLAVTREA